MRKAVAVLIAGVIVASVMLVGCGGGGGQSGAKAIKIAVAAPLTGDYAQYGLAFKRATELKAKEINDAGGINGAKIDLLFMDDKNDAKEAANVAQKIAADKDIVAEIGHFSSTCCLAAAPIYQKAGIVEFSPTSSHPDFTKQGTYMFRNVNTQAIEGPIVADMVVNFMQKKRIAVIYINNDWGITAKDNFVESAKKLGADVVAVETFVGGQTKDFSPILTKINAANPDVLVPVAFYSETGMIAQQMKQLGYNIPLAGLSALFNEELIKLAGSAVEGMYLTTNFFPADPSPHVRKFIDEFKKAYGAEPDQFAAVAYDTLGMLAEAIKKAGPNRAAIRDELAKMKDYPGVTGNITFNENRDVVKSMRVIQVKDGKFVLVK